MPLRDHFRPPVSRIAKWQEVHGAWPAVMAFRLNAILPPRFRSGVKVHLGSPFEVDVSSYDLDDTADPLSEPDNATQHFATSPALLVETADFTSSEYAVFVYDEERDGKLVAAVEIVSPSNKDRPEHRDEFVSKCHALLSQGVCVCVVDVVTERRANLFAELAERIGADPPAIADEPIYAVSCRKLSTGNRSGVWAWPHALAVGSPLPTLPLWLTDRFAVDLDLERTYEDTCRGLRIA